VAQAGLPVSAAWSPPFLATLCYGLGLFLRETHALLHQLQSVVLA